MLWFVVALVVVGLMFKFDLVRAFMMVWSLILGFVLLGVSPWLGVPFLLIMLGLGWHYRVTSFPTKRVTVRPESENRSRSFWYGLRPGDIVIFEDEVTTYRGEITHLDMSNNDRAYLRSPDFVGERAVACEWCTIVERVEDRIRAKADAYRARA